MKLYKQLVIPDEVRNRVTTPSLKLYTQCAGGGPCVKLIMHLLIGSTAERSMNKINDPILDALEWINGALK